MSEVTAVPLRPVGKSGIAALWAGVALLIGAGVTGGVYASQAPRMTALPPASFAKLPPEQFLAANAKRPGVKTTASGLQYQVLKKGMGATPGAGDVASVDYRGTLTTGVEFDASQPGQPVAMPIGGVVPGFAEALMLMPKGAKYRVWIPPQLGYGEREAGPIPPNSVLVFDITMHQFMTPPPGAMQGQ